MNNEGVRARNRSLAEQQGLDETYGGLGSTIGGEGELAPGAEGYSFLAGADPTAVSPGASKTSFLPSSFDEKGFDLGGEGGTGVDTHGGQEAFGGQLGADAGAGAGGIYNF